MQRILGSSRSYWLAMAGLLVALAGCRTGPPDAPGAAAPAGAACPPSGPSAEFQVRADNVTLAGHIGGEIHTLAARGSFVYATAGPQLFAIDAGNPAQPVLAGQSPTFGGTAYGLAVDGPYAFVGIGEGGVCIFDLADPAQPRALSTLATQGYIDEVLAQAGRLYYSESSYHREDYRTERAVHIVDVSDPARPVALGRYALSASDPGYFPSSVTGLAASETRLYIATTNYADTGQTLYVVDAADPARPALLGQLTIAGRPWGMNMGPPPTPRGLALSGDVVYLPRRFEGLSIIDVADPARPTEVGVLKLEAFPNELALEGRWLYITLQERVAGRVLADLAVVDVADPRRPVLSGTASAGGAAGPIALGPDAIYVAASGAVVQVLDRTIPPAPRPAGALAWPSITYDVGAARGYAYVTAAGRLFALDARDPRDIHVTALLPGVWGTPAISGTTLYVATDRSLSVFDIADPARPVALATLEPDWSEYRGDRTEVIISGNILYAGHQIVDVSDPAHPRRAGELPYGFRMAMSRGYGYFRHTVLPGIQIFDLSNPTQPRELGSYPLTNQIQDLAAAGDYLYVITSNSMVHVLDIRDGANPVPRGQLSIFQAGTLRADGRWLYVDGSRGLVVIDVADPDHPVVVAQYDHPSVSNRRFAVDGQTVYLASERGGVFVLRFDAGAARPLPPFTPVPTDTPPAVMVRP